MIYRGLIISLALTGTALAQGQNDFGPANPFYKPSTLPFSTPAFDHIRDQDYLPAIRAGMAAQVVEIARIAHDPHPPTFQNVFIPLERSGQLYQRATDAFNAVTSANTNPRLQADRTTLASEIAAHRDAIYLNNALFARVLAVHDSKAVAGLDPESKRLVDKTYDEFVRSGARLSSEKKEQLKQYNAELSTLSDSFIKKLLAATKAAAYHTDAVDALQGLSDAQIAAASESAKQRKLDGYLVALQNTTQQPIFTSLANRTTRQTILNASLNRAERGDDNDTRKVIARIAQLRAARAALLGFPSYAAWKLGDQMAKTPEAALAFMDALIPVSKAKLSAESQDIQKAIDADQGGFSVKAWDWDFYWDRVVKEKYQLDPKDVKPYFELDSVLRNGVFYAAHLLYGIDFKARTDLPTYHPDVRVFEVTDANGKPMALFYCDYFKRDDKEGGAWSTRLVGQSSLLHTRPVILNVANFSKPAAGQPALLTFEDVTTMFHEFGHALHAIFADTRYPSLSGTATPRDFVEFPSQFNEHWALNPVVFDNYARHYQTGAAMPPALRDKVAQSGYLGEGYKLTEVLAAAELDMRWHTLAEDAPLQDVDSFESKALADTGLAIETMPPRYRSSYFAHIWDSGYAAGYYAYLWTQMLADDAFGWFDEHGGLTRANGDRLRKMVLSRGNTGDLAEVYAAWRGRAPTVDAMLRMRGLKQ